MQTLLESGLAHCKVVAVDNSGLLVSLFMAGLLGGLTHCIGMCGPFVLSQVTARLEATPASAMREWQRLTGAALLPYHLGRMTTYMALGAGIALLAGGAVSLTGYRWLSALLLGLAALFFIGYALRALVPSLSLMGSGGKGESWWSRNVGRVVKPLFSRPLGWRGYLLGLALGFIPCGLLYGALAAAASAGDPLAGVMAMGAFAIGTMPSLLGVGLAGHMAGLQWREGLIKVAPVLLVVNAAILSYMAWQMLAV
ncbi:sulfite exporter TauE/SafE family protein [Magnetospira sp. QH-2]|uniref:sulfite exporter TauE/SafE family protein n=1 Tax=Magnetospira sp. (strain QH-2) TaxID=1288970 RepID=UPI0011DD96A6|nr:sulfite exporter TauE/SafE family protein [Magnetospira sp. QH-2]